LELGGYTEVETATATIAAAAMPPPIIIRPCFPKPRLCSFMSSLQRNAHG
jgi:hypothetical protein